MPEPQDPQGSRLPSQAAAELTQAILARTSGSPCQRLRSLACAFLDGELDALQDSLVRAHLEHCPACAALTSAMGVADRVLATFAGADPGPWFTQRVLLATVHEARRQVADGIDRRGLWSRLLHRPRICLEAAYLGAAAGLMGFYLPMPTVPLAGRVPALVQPLKASTQRVAEEVLLTGLRTQASLKSWFQPRPLPKKPALGIRDLWQRWSAKVRLWVGWALAHATRAGNAKPVPPNL